MQKRPDLLTQMVEISYPGAIKIES